MRFPSLHNRPLLLILHCIRDTWNEMTFCQLLGLTIKKRRIHDECPLLRLAQRHTSTCQSEYANIHKGIDTPTNGSLCGIRKIRRASSGEDAFDLLSIIIFYFFVEKPFYVNYVLIYCRIMIFQVTIWHARNFSDSQAQLERRYRNAPQRIQFYAG